MVQIWPLHLSRGLGVAAGGIIDTVAGALYDGCADWHDESVAPFGLAATEAIRRLVGPGRGDCLDLG